MDIQARLSALRAQMRAHHLDAYIVPGTDPHASEYMASHWAEMQWITGFTGESGTAVITRDKALLWTDSRYYLQAEHELQGTEVILMRESDIHCPSISEWLTKNSQPTTPLCRVGINPEMSSVGQYEAMCRVLQDGGLTLCPIDLIEKVWTEERPSIPMSAASIYDDQYAGDSVENKLTYLRDTLRQQNCDAIVLSALDEIGWLLNLRGDDVPFTPCVIAYVVVEQARCNLFIDSAKVDSSTRRELEKRKVSILPYEEVYPYLQQTTYHRVMIDPSRVNQALYGSFPSQTQVIRNTPSPVQTAMSIKNPVEIEGTREAMKRDGVALTKFFYWLAHEAKENVQTEVSLANQLHLYRTEGERFVEESFATIAGWKGNGAIVHYHAEEPYAAKIEGDGVLLLDSGGQYLDGTTDITRTLWIGNPQHIPSIVKQDFTRVLKGHIALARARFPEGTRGNQLDILARQFLWQDGITYGHGTGHGVGHFMGCHEGPANIRTDNNNNPIRLGNIFSDEPGVYRTNEYGIRIENLIAVKKVTEQLPYSTDEVFYEFETLTLCYYDVSLIDQTLLTDEETEWINQYHQRVYHVLSPLLDTTHQAFLKEKCQPIRNNKE